MSCKGLGAERRHRSWRGLACGWLLGLTACGGGGASAPAGALDVDVGTLPSTQASRVLARLVNPLDALATVTEAHPGVGLRVDPSALPLSVGASAAFDLPLLVAPQSGGPASFSLTLRFEGNGGVLLRDLSVRARFDPAVIESAPGRLEFGILDPGSSRVLGATLRNRSVLSPVNVSSVTLPSAQFTLLRPALPVSIAPNQVVTFDLEYRPTTRGWHDGEVVLGPTDLGVNVRLGVGAGDPELDGEETLDLGPVSFVSGLTEPLLVPVPADAISLCVEVVGDAADVFEVAELTGPDGRTYAPTPYGALPSVGTGIEVCSYTIPDTDAAGGALVAGGGTYGVRFRLTQGTGGSARARAILELRPGATAAQGRLDLNLWLAAGLPIDASSALADPTLIAALARTAQVLLEQGIELGDVDTYDVGDPSLDYLGEGELPSLFGLSAGAARVRANVFLALDPAGFGGYAARIGGPKRNGTRASGVVVGTIWANSADRLGLVIAHELGHLLGLFHTVEVTGEGDLIGDTGNEPNLMSLSADGPLTSGQGFVVRRHPFLRPVPRAPSKRRVWPTLAPLAQGVLPEAAAWCACCARADAAGSR